MEAAVAFPLPHSIKLPPLPQLCLAAASCDLRCHDGLSRGCRTGPCHLSGRLSCRTRSSALSGRWYGSLDVRSSSDRTTQEPPSSSLVSASSREGGSDNGSGPAGAREGGANPEQLQEAFGCAGVSFGGSASLPVARLAAANGSSATVLLDGARVTSYKAAMWHGGFEEVLYTKANEPEEGQDGAVRGGAIVSCPNSGRGVAGVAPVEPEAEGIAWSVAGASGTQGKSQEVVLRLHSLPRKGAAEGIQLSLTVRLTPSSLILHLGARNEGPAPALLAASLGAHVAVATTRGAYLMGLEGSACRVGQLELGRRARKPPGGGGGLARLLRPLMGAAPAGGGGEGEEGGGRGPGGPPGSGAAPESLHGVRGMAPEWVTERSSEVGLAGPIDRVYRGAAAALVLLDRGKRRSFQLQSAGFEDFVVRNPGEACGLKDWDDFAFVGPARRVELAPAQSWEASFRIINLGAV